MARANELSALGHDVIHLEVGEPDFATPQPIVDEAKRVLISCDNRVWSLEKFAELCMSSHRNRLSCYWNEDQLPYVAPIA